MIKEYIYYLEQVRSCPSTLKWHKEAQELLLLCTINKIDIGSFALETEQDITEAINSFNPPKAAPKPEKPKKKRFIWF